MIRARVDRHRCIGAGNCITIAPSAFDWHEGDFAKADVVDPGSVEDDLLRARKTPLAPDDPALFDPAHPRIAYPGPRPVKCR